MLTLRIHSKPSRGEPAAPPPEPTDGPATNGAHPTHASPPPLGTPPDASTPALTTTASPPDAQPSESKRPGGGGLPRFPRRITVLSVSWFHGRLEAVAIQRGAITGTWVRPEPCDEPSRFGDLVKEAAARTGYAGSAISLVLAHPRLTHQLVETPPAKGTALETLVRRQIERLKVFEGDAALAIQRALPTKNSQSVLVHLFPQILLDQLVLGASKAGFHLASVVPPTALLQGQLGRLPLKPDQAALIAADTGVATTVLVGRPDGQLMLGRSLDAAGARPDSNPLAVDLNRTILFGSQQFGVSVESVWLYGEALATRVEELAALLQVPVQVSPEPTRPLYWAMEAARLSASQLPNLVSTEQQKAPQRRILLVAATAVALVLLLAAGVTASVCQLLIRKEKARMGELEQRITAATRQHQELQQTHLQLDRQSEMVRQVVDDRPAPIPAWFLAYVGEAVPSDLRVTNLVVRQTGLEWELHLSGLHQPGTNAASASAAVLGHRVDALAQRLAEGPFHVQVLPTTDAPEAAMPAGSSKSAFQAVASWASRFTSTTPTPSAKPADYFVLEGRMR